MKRLVILLLVLFLVGCKQYAEQPVERPIPVQPAQGVYEQPARTVQPVEQVSTTRAAQPTAPQPSAHEICVQSALSKAEQCLLSGKDVAVCKAESETALEACKGLSS